jgi:hypothetical protein
MGKLRVSQMVLLGTVFLVLLGCQSAGTPKQSAGGSTKTAAAGPQAQRTAGSTKADKAAVKAAEKKQTAAARRAERKARPQAAKLAKKPRTKPVGAKPLRTRLAQVKPFQAILGKPLPPLRGILYASVALIALVVVGAIAAERAGRRRKMSPST